MTILYQQIGRPYWRGYEAPSTAYVTTDLVNLRFGSDDFDIVPILDESSFPDVIDILVEICPVKSTVNPMFNHNGLQLSVYGSGLKDYNVQEVKFKSLNLIRKAGVIEKNIYSAIELSEQFRVHPSDVILSQTQPLGCFWQENAPYDAICQYQITFYEADDEVRYHLDKGDCFLQSIRDGALSVTLTYEDSASCVYHTVDLVRHGTTTAWLTFHKR